jgi:hypothetical protein
VVGETGFELNDVAQRNRATTHTFSLQTAGLQAFQLVPRLHRSPRRSTQFDQVRGAVGEPKSRLHELAGGRIVPSGLRFQSGLHPRIASPCRPDMFTRPFGLASRPRRRASEEQTYVPRGPRHSVASPRRLVDVATERDGSGLVIRTAPSPKQRCASIPN